MPTMGRMVKHCVYCRRPESEVGGLSGRHICRECGTEAVVDACLQQKAKSGPVWERRVRNLARATAREARALTTGR